MKLDYDDMKFYGVPLLVFAGFVIVNIWFNIVLAVILTALILYGLEQGDSKQ